jgi:hypothetical protein
VKFNELANRHGELLLRLTKQIQDTRGSREQDVHKTAVSEYEEALKVAKLFAIYHVLSNFFYVCNNFPFFLLQRIVGYELDCCTYGLPEIHPRANGNGQNLVGQRELYPSRTCTSSSCRSLLRA